MPENIKSKILKALIKKAVGYSAKETVKEYQITDGGEEVLIKKKVSQKVVPPDIHAAKMLMDSFEKRELTELSDDELKTEKERLLQLLKENMKNETDKNKT